jgi:hypothetical protein
MFFNIRYLPLKQQQFAAERWIHESHHVVATLGFRAIEQIFLYHSKNRSGEGCSKGIAMRTVVPFLSKNLHCTFT